MAFPTVEAVSVYGYIHDCVFLGDVRVSGSTMSVQRNTIRGTLFTEGTQHTIAGNHIANVNDDGIVSECDRSIIADNMITTHGDTGIYLDGTNTLVSGCQVPASALALGDNNRALRIASGSGHRVSGCNFDYGVEILGGNDNEITDCFIDSNQIHLFSLDVVAGSVRLPNNRVTPDIIGRIRNTGTIIPTRKTIYTTAGPPVPSTVSPLDEPIEDDFLVDAVVRLTTAGTSGATAGNILRNGGVLGSYSLGVGVSRQVVALNAEVLALDAITVETTTAGGGASDLSVILRYI